MDIVDSCPLVFFSTGAGSICFSSVVLRRRWRLIVIVWRPFEHISARSFKTVGDREKVLVVACKATRELPFGVIAAAQWLTTGPTEARVCVCDLPTDARIDRPIFAHITRKCVH